MRATRRQFILGTASAAGAAALSACVPPTRGGVAFPTPACDPPLVGGPAPLPPPGTAGLVDEALWQGRVDEYLAHATTSLNPTSSTSVVAHVVRNAREPGFGWDPSLVTPAMVNPDPYRDTLDFELMTYQWLVRLGQGVLPDDTMAAITDAIAGCRYRYDDPLPAGEVDHKWFWSENHRILFAVDEYLGGLALADRTFTFTGMTGAEHAARSRERIVEWLEERSRFGFSEWHSNTYMKYSYSPLVTLIEFADDVELVALAACVLDECFFGLASHTLGGTYGVTHGRAYKPSKTNGLAEATFGTAKLLFDTADAPYPGGADIGPAFLCGSTRYRLPEAIRQVARTDEVAVIRERHGVHLDPHETFSLAPEAPFGYHYDDEAHLPFWWAHGAMTSWQLIGGTLAAAKRWNLFDTELFSKFKAAEQFLDLPPVAAQIAVRELSPMTAAGVLGEAHTYTWRSPDAMLSTVADHRFGDAVEQMHAWQATLDPRAIVFTTHPSKPVRQSTNWGDDNGYWVGSASMPRSAQQGRAAIHIYRPSYVSPTDPLLGPVFGYQPFTHAYFPQSRFDEVATVGHWVCGRKGDGYVALWSERPTEWRVYDPSVEATDGMALPFDLLAPGGADNAWVVEVGRAADHGSFAAFVAAIGAAAVVAERRGAEVFVSYASPTEGTLTFGTKGAFAVDGVERALRDHPRHSSPWAEKCELSLGLDVRAGGARLAQDASTRGRLVEG